MTSSLPVLVLNGPNLNLLGQRQPEFYGRGTLDDVVSRCEAAAEKFGAVVEAKQSNHEGQLIDWIHEA
ncbi:MAG: type II 3-dehydroquinate dehydratase, partial [Rhodococcus sp. (in: high G+C Gram-positive bacteria)]